MKFIKMMKKKHVTFFVLFFLFFYTEAYPQENNKLTLEESLKFALENSYSIKDSELEMIRQKKSILSWQAALKSNGWFYVTIPEFDESITQEFNTETEQYEFYKLKSLKYQSSIVINQPIPSNGRFSINTQGLKLSQYDAEADYTSSFFIQFNQPIFTPNSLQREIYKADLSYKNAEYRYIRTRLNVIYQRISDRYNELIRRKLKLKNSEWKFEILKKYRGDAKIKYENNEIAEMDYLQLDVELSIANDRFISSSTDFSRRKAEFKQQIGLKVDDDLSIFTEIKVDREIPNISLAIDKAIENNIDLKTSYISVCMDSLEIEERESENEFKGDIILSYGLDNTDKKISRLFKNFDKTSTIKMNFYVPLWDWGRNKDRLQAEYINYINTRQWLEDRKKRLFNNVYTTLERIRVAENRLRLNREILDMSEKMNELSYGKFLRNEISAQDLILSVNQLYESKNDYADSIINYENAFNRLKVLTLWDFEKNSYIFENISKEISDIEKRAYEENNW